MGFSESVEQYLQTGEHSLGENEVFDRDERASEASLRRILGRVLTYRARRAPLRQRAAHPEPQAVILERVGPMVRGLLGADAEVALGPLAARVVVIDAAGFDALTADVPLADAWALANMVLDDMGAPPLSDDVPAIDGLVSGGRAWIPASALGPAGPFTDILAHEVAHLLHELTRADVGLCGGLSPLLTVTPCARETYAYACEVWACIERSAPPGVGRQALVQQYCNEYSPADHRVDLPRLRGALIEAASGERQPWECILQARTPRVAVS